MRADVAEYPSEDVNRNASVYLWIDSSVADLLNGTAVETPADYSDIATSVKLDNTSLKVKLEFNDELLNCTTQPRPGHLMTLIVDNVYRFIGIVDAVSEYVEQRGTRSVTIVSRTREGVGLWKSLYSVSRIYPLGTNYIQVLEDICEELMQLDQVEYDFPQITQTVPHYNVQFAEMTPWEMITRILFAAKMIPTTNVLNQVTAYGFDTLRVPDVTIHHTRVIGVKGSKQNTTIGRVRLIWTDPEFHLLRQPEQLLGSTAMTAGYFQRVQEEKIWWSADHRQRADNIRMHIVRSVNDDGIVSKVAEEDLILKDEYHCEIRLTTKAWVPTLLTISIAALLGQSLIPDEVIVPPLGGTVPTIPIGRVIEAAAMIAILTVMVSMGVGRYEIYGTPYDYIIGKNSIVAYADNLQAWLLREEEVENNWINDAEQAQDVAVSKLLLECARGFSMTIDLVDDPRIEVGDIVQFEDGTKIFVESFSNDFTRGAPAIISITGVRI